MLYAVARMSVKVGLQFFRHAYGGEIVHADEEYNSVFIFLSVEDAHVSLGLVEVVLFSEARYSAEVVLACFRGSIYVLIHSTCLVGVFVRPFKSRVLADID